MSRGIQIIDKLRSLRFTGPSLKAWRSLTQHWYSKPSETSDHRDPWAQHSFAFKMQGWTEFCGIFWSEIRRKVHSLWGSLWNLSSSDYWDLWAPDELRLLSPPELFKEYNPSRSVVYLMKCSSSFGAFGTPDCWTNFLNPFCPLRSLLKSSEVQDTEIYQIDGVQRLPVYVEYRWRFFDPAGQVYRTFCIVPNPINMLDIHI